MKLVELSTKKLEEENKKLYNLIIKDYDYDLVIFIARGSYKIGSDIANLNNSNLIEIFAKRKGGKLKKVLRPILSIIPKSLKTILRKKEFNSDFHEKNFDRKISYNKIKWMKYKNSKKILIVDDSIDTGYSIKFVKDEVEKFFKGKEIRIAALNYFKKSEKIVKADYFLYADTMLLGPWSNDSKENKEYLKEYGEWHDKFEKE